MVEHGAVYGEFVGFVVFSMNDKGLVQCCFELLDLCEGVAVVLGTVLKVKWPLMVEECDPFLSQLAEFRFVIDRVVVAPCDECFERDLLE